MVVDRQKWGHESGAFTPLRSAVWVRMQPLWEDAASLSTARAALIAWYEQHHRRFPWRETTDAYPILVSEVMSQQTQLERVEPAFRAFLQRWPAVEDLARSSTDAVVRFWTTHALGYNRRARYLHAAAGQIVEEFDGVVPPDPAVLQTLPGWGPTPRVPSPRSRTTRQQRCWIRTSGGCSTVWPRPQMTVMMRQSLNSSCHLGPRGCGTMP
jgi:A/G-specific DNA-adenine glycosylase (EC 3.2.2.-)